MLGFVRLQLPGGKTTRLSHGNLIGRGDGAHLPIDDPAVSRVHAQIIRRHRGLCLIKRGGPLVVNGQICEVVRLRGGQLVELSPATTIEVLEVVDGAEVPSGDTTHRTVTFLKLTARFESVEITRPDLPAPVVLTGKQAAIIIELVRMGEPVHWYRIARRVWPKPADRSLDDHKERLCRIWHTTLGRLRGSLERAGIRPNLVFTSGGTVRLALLKADVLQDETE